MKGDFSRSTFDPTNHYKRVLLQQGRVQTDADANEQQAITLHRVETEAADLIGGCGGPIHDAGFEIMLYEPVEHDLLIGAGRYYVGGVLCENDEHTRYSEQPDYPNFPKDLGEGTYLVCLHRLEHHLTWLDAPIREVALGGPDTATRTKTVWQVKLHRLTEEEAKRADCLGTIPSWDSATAPSTGTLIAQTAESEPSDDPCIVTPGAGYRRLENQLYRVEVHEGGVIGDPPGATFKWDRDNGTIVARLQSTDLEEWTVSSVGRDDVLRFAPNDWIELTDDTHELHGLPGTLVRIVSVEGNLIRVDLNKRYPTGDSVDMADFPLNPKVRRWNGVLGTVTDDSPQPLEDGVQVRLRAVDDAENDLSYRTGDYWTIPARTNTGDVEWPLDESENPVWRPAEGIHHHYCRLALAMFDGTEWALISDCRTLFPPVTELTSLFYVGGDGQAGVANDTLPNPLQVGVANGSHPVHGATIRYTVTHGDGLVNDEPEVEVTTGRDGIASVKWTLGAEDEQRVEAMLLNAAGEPVHLPVRFGAQFDVDAAEPGIHIEHVQFSDGSDFHNDTQVTPQELAGGITIEFDTAPGSAIFQNPALAYEKPVCYVTLYLPYPLNSSDIKLWGDERRLGTRPLRLDASILEGSASNQIVWRPSNSVQDWLIDRNRLFETLNGLGLGGPILGYLTLKGNVIWSEVASGDRLYLDGEAFGVLRADGSGSTALDLATGSGDNRRGGDFELWFWLVSDTDERTPRINIESSEFDLESLERPELNFGQVSIRSNRKIDLVVSNTGTAELIVNVSLQSQDTGFAIDRPPEPSDITLLPDETLTLTVLFAPPQLKKFEDSMVIKSNDPVNSLLEIRLRGEGIPFG